MNTEIYNAPMTRIWFRDAIGTVYAWDYQERYFYMLHGGKWWVLSEPHMQIVLENLQNP
jgi:hypothetical protein